MAEILTVERRRELRQLAAGVTSVEDAHRIIEEKGLRADPGENTTVFYYGSGVEGAKALTTREGYVRLEQTERGYFLDQVTRNLAEDGVIPRGSEQNTALFGDKTPNRLGEWGEASKELAENTHGCPVVFPDQSRGPERFKETAFYNAELPALTGRADVTGITTMDYLSGEHLTGQEFAAPLSFTPMTAPFANDEAYGLNESQLIMVRVGGETAADVIHSLGGDFGAVQAPSQQPAYANAQPQGVVTVRSIPTRPAAAAPDREPVRQRR